MDGVGRSIQLECRACGLATGQYPVGQEHLAEAEWARINEPARPAVAAALRQLVGLPVVLILPAPAAGSISGPLDLVEGVDGYEVQHGAAVVRFRPSAILRVEGRRVVVRRTG